MLKSIGVTTTLAASGLLQSMIYAAPSGSANDKLRVGLIGAGNRAKWLTRSLSREFHRVELVAVCDCYLPQIDLLAADYAKAKTTQLTVSLCLHLGTGFPTLWNLGGSADSERGLLLSMLDRLPANARLIMDAYYFAFDFWNHLIDSRVTFVVRAGKNIDLLGKLSMQGTFVLRIAWASRWLSMRARMPSPFQRANHGGAGSPSPQGWK